MNKITEKFKSDKEYEVGTVVVFGGTSEITQSLTVNDSKVAGVIVSNTENTEIVILGIAYCKVVGRVNKGDLITTSNTPGYAVKALNPSVGSILGKAILDKVSGEAGIIPIMVTLV